MIVKTVRIPYRRSFHKFNLYLIGDEHLATVFCVEPKVKQKYKEIGEDPIGLWLNMGDRGEYITPDDPRWEPNDKLIAPWVRKDDIAACIEEKIVEIQTSAMGKLENGVDKCIGEMLGNHENSYRKHHYGNVHKHICDKLGVDDLGFSCMIRFIFERENSNEHHQLLGVFTHGTSGATTEAGKKAALRRFMSYFPTADFFGYGHTHTIDNVEVVALDTQPDKSPAGFKIKNKIQHGMLTGCYFKTYGNTAIPSYGEFKLYPPTRIGCAKFIINAQTGEVEPEAIEPV